MTDRTASAVFDSREEAERALSELRSAGIKDAEMSIVGKSESGDGSGMTDNDDDGVNEGGAVKGALMGGGAGALLGLAALAIPGVGPLAAAGAIAASAAPGAAGIGAALGATAGGLSGLLTDNGVSDEDASYYEERINQGGYFVAVHGDQSDRAREILFRNGGHNAGQSKMASA